MAQPNFRAAMPDIQAMIAAKQKMPSGAENINTGLHGMMKGMEMVEAVSKITKRQQSAKAMADYLKSDLGKKMVEETGLPPSVIENADPQTLVNMQQTVAKNKVEMEKINADKKISPYEQVQGELIKEWRLNPKAFKTQYGDEGIKIIKGEPKGADFLTGLIKAIKG